MNSWSFKHPELSQQWHTTADTKEAAAQRFEDCWALRIPQGLLEHVDGSFFDGETIVGDGEADNLCAYDLSGHFWQPDLRICRLEFLKPGLKPIICIMCQETHYNV